MNAKELKEYLASDTERIMRLLESLGCHSLWMTGGEVRGAPPEGTNNTSISVTIDTMFCRYYSSGETFRGDIFSFIEMMEGITFSEAVNHTRQLFGIASSYKKGQQKIDPLKHFRIAKPRRSVNIDKTEVAQFGEEALSGFVMLPHINLFYEGIMPQTSELFKVCYDPKLDRILFPHYHYGNKDKIVGITGRTTLDSAEAKAFGIPKYWNYIKGYKKMYNLYGFHLALENAKESKMLVIAEAEKSVLKEFTFRRNKGYSVAVGGHEVDVSQVQIVLKHLPEDVEVVIAFDKDVMEMIDDDDNTHDEDGNHLGIKFLEKTCKMFSAYRNTSYIYDTEGLLGDHDSPMDKGYLVYQKLLEGRVKVSN